MDIKSEASGIVLFSGCKISFEDSIVDLHGDELRKFILSNMDQPFKIGDGFISISEFISFLTPIKELIEDMFLLDLDILLESAYEFEKMNIDVIVSRQFNVSEKEEFRSFYQVEFEESKSGRLCLSERGCIELVDGVLIPISQNFTLYEAISVLLSELPDIFESFSKDSFQL
jgi:hypothetical protein